MTEAAGSAADTGASEGKGPPRSGSDQGDPPHGSVAAVLAEVERWFRAEEARHESEILEVDQEIANLQTALANLQTQLGSLHEYRAELGRKVRSFGAEHAGRAHRSLYGALLRQQALLQEREQQVAVAAAEREAALPESLSTGPIGALIQEYEQFKTSVEPTLGALPESYRAVVLKHHHSVTDRLRDHLARVLGEPLHVEGDEIAIEVAIAIDAPAGEPVGLVVLLPVDEEAYGQWAERGDGLGLWIACRVVQAVYEAAATAEFPRAQVVAGGHQGLLVIEIDLTGAEPSFVEQLEAQLILVLSTAPELEGAGVRVWPRRVHIDYVMPPEDENSPPGGPTDA
jgi:hypothetical protein